MKLKINGVKKFNHLGKIEVIFISKKELSITSIIPNTKKKAPIETNRFNFSLLGLPKKFKLLIIFP
jgi:hypothetical protein